METIIVSVIVFGALLFGIRSLYRTMKGDNDGCAGCGCGCTMPKECSETAKDTSKG
ncbi:MAG: FeoB-associated Cys-rich membrane protein [Deltaproteobacteria bacterium]|nr:FeoB-associated Cys-rich membrane protein [Candidatus Zymogenaceae bacterium]